MANASQSAKLDSSYNPHEKRWHERRFVRRTLVPWLFILPILLLHLLVVMLPSVSALYYSLTDWSGIGKPEFVGLANFRTMVYRRPCVYQSAAKQH